MTFSDGVQLGAGFVVGAGLVWLGLILILALIAAVAGGKKDA
ncbi:hypothetical protein [Thermus phage P23-77]|uniref:Uncharacterized protein n=1 Tax=Thermus virus P23-77 TaxID=1714272 RepID=C8CHM3_9VIRU|nr:hypothetical protein P23-77_gp27 [Thermus phage P23-77]ACV05052.1 hypothetical protein [Thermus phage P23-77]